MNQIAVPPLFCIEERLLYLSSYSLTGTTPGYPTLSAASFKPHWIRKKPQPQKGQISGSEATFCISILNTSQPVTPTAMSGICRCLTGYSLCQDEPMHTPLLQRLCAINFCSLNFKQDYRHRKDVCQGV